MSKAEFVGRVRELQEIENLRRRAESGQGGLVVVRGERGIGKTALVSQFVESLPASDSLSLKVTCNDRWGDGITPFLDSIVSYYEHQTASAVKSAIHQGLVETARNSGVFGSILANLLAARSASMALPEVGPAINDQPLVLYRACWQAFTKLAGRRLLALWVEDIQWLDDEGLRLLGYLADRAREQRAFVVATYRSGFCTTAREEAARDYVARLEEEPAVSWINLGALDETETARILSARLGLASLPSAIVVRALQERTNGNPYFALAVADILAQERTSATGSEPGGSVSVQSIAAIPRSVERVVLRQLARVYSEVPDSKKTLDTASVVGETFELEAMRYLLPSEAGSIRSRLNEIGSRFQIVDEIVKALLFSFRHSTIQEVVYANLGVDAKSIHSKVADYIRNRHPERCYELYYHLRAAGRIEEAEAPLHAAIEQRVGLRMFSSVVDLCREYFGLAESLGRGARAPLAEVRLAYSGALYSTGKPEVAAGILRELLATLRNENSVIRINTERLLGQCLYRSSSRDDHLLAVETLTGALGLAEESRCWDLSGEIQIARAPALDKIGKLDESREAYRDGVRLIHRAIAESDSDSVVRLEVLMADTLRKACMVMDPLPGIELMEGALATFRRRGMRFDAARCLTNIGAEYFYIGNFGLARKYSGEAREVFQSIGGDPEPRSLNNLGLIDLAEGDIPGALERFRMARPLCQESSDGIYVDINTATAERLAGRGEEAEALLVGLEPQVTAFEEAHMLDHYYFNRAMLRLDRQDYREAAKLLTKVPPHSFRSDDGLIRGKRAKYLSIAYAKLKQLGDASEAEAEARVAFSTTKPQRWTYELDYYPCELEFWGP